MESGIRSLRFKDCVSVRSCFSRFEPIGSFSYCTTFLQSIPRICGVSSITLIPIFIGELLEQGKMSVKVLKTNDTWYGMTYHEDVAAVKDSFKKMLANGVYKADLFSDL